ncbi:hypothetical protein Ciccas_010453 [Cichlidogyrus casuarinus]|uniref:poly(ADP-ribose) glycohydrolase n=1 Tax=Cichlidogyrus casuarinus TaxID=1844966 RepID=A0ABD2PUF3_9PLAT
MANEDIDPSDEDTNEPMNSTSFLKLAMKWKKGMLSLPHPSNLRDLWDSHHVRMPFSPKNQYPGPSNELEDRWSSIVNALRSEMTSFSDIPKLILSYNKRFSGYWNFHVLSSVCEQNKEECLATLRLMSTVATMLPDLITNPIPLMKKGRDMSLTFNQFQLCSLLTNAFFCTFPRRNKTGPNSEYDKYPTINFSNLLSTSRGESYRSKSRKREKVRCLMAYFAETCQKIAAKQLDSFRLVSFSRHVLKQPPDWSRSKRPIAECKLTVSVSGAIEDCGPDTLQVDFANKFLGGGVIGTGCVQEEILLCIKPEMIAGRLFVQVLEDNECLLICGAQRYSNYTGYGDSFKFDGPVQDHLPTDSWNRLNTHVAVIDALIFHDLASQVHSRYFTRELNKAYCAFSASLPKVVATGHWGCGAFGGCKEIKAIIQLMACAQSSKHLAYFTFGDEQFQERFLNVYRVLIEADKTVADLRDIVTEFSESLILVGEEEAEKMSIFDYIVSNR